MSCAELLKTKISGKNRSADTDNLFKINTTKGQHWPLTGYITQSVTPVPRTSSGPLRRMRQLKRVRAVSLMQQLHRPTTERVLLADLHVELRSLLSLLGNWQADQFVYNWHPNFERGNYRENCAYYNGISTVLYSE